MLSKNKLYTISFAEGASVMAAEICGAKLLAPFFGSSLYVWSSVMAITLGGLASGYFIGGKLSKRENKEKTLLYILVAAVCCLCLMPFLSSLFLIAASGLSLIPAVVISVFFLLFPTMLTMGATSPLIISILTQDASHSGENSGRVYAISTVGGIVATFLCGFYLIPNLGVQFSLIGFAIVLSVVSLFLVFKKKSKNSAVILFFVISTALFGFTNSEKNIFTIYKSESVLGKLEIRDEPSENNDGIIIRKLLINTTIQTEMNIKSGQSVSEYVRLVEKNVPYFPKGKVLVLGLGGGVVANMFHNFDYKVTAVEFDERIIKMAKQFFYLNDSVKTVCADARYFINQSKEKYDLVLFDVFKAEEQPSHVITKESLVKLKSILNPDAVILINTHGYLKGKLGLGTQCMMATLKDAGFDLKICTFSEDENYRNLLIVASLKPMDVTLNDELYPIIISNSEVINTDNKPIMEALNAPANQTFRSLYLKNYILWNY
ncbi:MAG: fused MFS/spermidine synthase [Burkholderiales bacterium]|nr:fused MFS/spermidine synthase [Bacteroidia bacterium]